MSYVKSFIEQSVIDRRRLLLASGLGLGAYAANKTLGPVAAYAAKDPVLAWGFQARSSPYTTAVQSGAEAFVKSLGKPVADLLTFSAEGSNEKILADIKALIRKTDGNCAIATNTNDTPNCRPIVEAVKEGGAFVFTNWHKPDDLHPWDIGDAWVGHMTWNDVDPSEKIATALFEAMGGEGAIIGLGGIAANGPAIQRRIGLDKALAKNPNIKLLDYQAADWDTNKANEVMASLLTTYGDQIKGVFAASDTMAFGAIEALRAEGLAGDVKVVGYDAVDQAVQYVASGEMVATCYTNPVWAGGISLALARAASLGEYKPSDEPHSHREMLGPTLLITAADAKAFQEQNAGEPNYDWSDFFGLSAGQITYE